MIKRRNNKNNWIKAIIKKEKRKVINERRKGKIRIEKVLKGK